MLKIRKIKSKRKFIDIDLGFIPRLYQEAAHALRKRFSILVWHRRSGKTVYAIIELLLAAMFCTLANGRFAYIAPYYGQAKSVAWDYLKRFASAIPNVQIKEAELTVILPGGASVRLFGADNPESLRGLYFDGVVLDEVADMKPNIWESVVRPCLSDRLGWAMFIGTAKGLNLFSKLYYDAIKDPEWYHDMKRWNDTNIIPIAEIEQLKREMAPAIFAQEYECDFNAAVENAFIPLQLLLEAESRPILNPHSYDFAALTLGCDIARFGNDRTVFFPKQGLQAFIPYIHRNLDTMQVAAQISNRISDLKTDMAFIDEIGIGAGVLDRLRQTGTRGVLGVTSGSESTQPRFKNLRAEMISKVRDWLKAGGVMPKVEGLDVDFCAPTYWYDAADRLQIESKEQMRKRGLPSCDLLDAFALNFAMPVQKKTELQKLSSRGYGKIETWYDVLG